MIDFIVNKISIKKMQLLFIFVAIFFSLFLITDPSHAITITGSDTITKNSSSPSSTSGCSGTVSWGVTNSGASINQSGVLTTANGCGSVLVAARCSADGAIATKNVRVTDAGTWVLTSSVGPSHCPPCTPVPCGGAGPYYCTTISGDTKVDWTAYCHNTIGCPSDLGSDPCNLCPGYLYSAVAYKFTYEWRCLSSSTCAYNITPQAEVCGDLKDNNCNGQVDEGCVVCEDKDGDGYNAISPTCPQGADAYDNDSTVYPGAPEKPDNKDNDNDGQTDENSSQCPNSTPTSSTTSLSTGNYQHTQDVSGITLIYDSRRTSEGAFGKGWTHSYDTKIKIDTDSSLELTEDGVATNFRLAGNIYTAEPRSGLQAEIAINSDNTYTLTRKDGIVYQFNSTGRLLSITDRNGNQTTLAYINNLLTSVTDPTGRAVTLSYNAANTINAITDHAGRAATFGYDAGGLLNTVTNLDAGIWTYSYDSNDRMTSKTDPLGSTTSNTYDTNGRMIMATNPEGKTKAIAYDQTNKTSTVTEWNGGVWQYKYDDLLNVQTEIADPDGNIRTKTYDANKNLVSETDPQGNTTTYTYDTAGNMTSVKDAAGNVTAYTYNSFGQATSVTDSQGKQTGYVYDANGNLTLVTDSSGAITQYQYDTKGNVTVITDAEGKTTAFTYDQYNSPVSITDSTGATTTFTYDISGNTTSVTDSQGSTTRFEYNSQNQVVKVIDSTGNVTSSAYDAMGNRTSQTDANGNVTRYEYNYKGQVTKVIDSLGGITTYEYGGTGCASCSGGTDKLTALTDAVGNRTSYEYDLLGRLIKETDTEGKIIVYSYDATGNLISKATPDGITVGYVYDSLNRLASINFPDSTQKISYTYDSTGKVLTMTDPSGATSYIYDNSNRLTSEIKTIEGKTFNISYNYSLAGVLTSLTYPSGRVISYIYDSNGRVVKVTETKDSITKDIVTSITYNTNGTVSDIVYANGIQTTKGYDVKGILNSLNIGNLKQLSYTRDNVGNIMAINDLLDSSKTKSYVYDALYRLTNATGQWGTISYGYDGVGNRTTETSTSGTTNYSYSANKLISSIGAKAFEFSYDNNGNTVSENQKTYIYNQNQRLIKAVENDKTLGEYLYNANGQRVKKIANGRTTYFIYDQSGNMIGEYDEQGQVNIDYIYLGSVPIARADEWWEGLKLPEGPTGLNLIPGDTQLSVSWNPNTDTGTDTDTDTDTVVDGYKVYWGAESGKYASSADVGKTTSHIISNLINGTTYYVSVTAYADIKRTLFYHADHLGTPIILTDSNGSIVWSGEFSPFGEEYSSSSSVLNNLGFPGQYRDSETGLHYNWWRYYYDKIGRYYSIDPVLRYTIKTTRAKCLNAQTNPLELNPYIYTMGNPINLIDPTGEASSGSTGKCGNVDGCLECFKKNGNSVIKSAVSQLKSWNCDPTGVGCATPWEPEKKGRCCGYAKRKSLSITIVGFPKMSCDDTCHFVAHEIDHAVYGEKDEQTADNWATNMVPECCKNK